MSLMGATPNGDNIIIRRTIMKELFFVCVDRRNGNNHSRLFLQSVSNNLYLWTAAQESAKSFKTEKEAIQFCQENSVELKKIEQTNASWETRIVPQAPTRKEIKDFFESWVEETISGDNPEEVLITKDEARNAYNNMRLEDQIVLALVLYGETLEDIGRMYNRSLGRVNQVYSRAKCSFKLNLQ